MQSFSAFIFAYNEAPTLKESTAELHEKLVSLKRDFELVIIDDGSTDGTAEIADDLARELRGVRAVHHDANLGLGSVYRTAFKEAKKDLLMFFCADGQFAASMLDAFLPQAEDHDMVLGYIPARDDPKISLFLSKMEKLLLRALFGPIPKFQGAMMFKRKLLEQIELKSPGGKAWTVLLELIIKANRKGCKIISIPTQIRKRTVGRSKVNNITTIAANLRQAFILRRYV